MQQGLTLVDFGGGASCSKRGLKEYIGSGYFCWKGFKSRVSNSWKFKVMMNQNFISRGRIGSRSVMMRGMLSPLATSIKLFISIFIQDLCMCCVFYVCTGIFRDQKYKIIKESYIIIMLHA